MQWTRTNCCTSHCMAQECVGAHFTSSTSSSMCAAWSFVLSLLLTLFLSVFYSYPLFFYLNLELNLFLHVDVIGAISHWHSANWGVPLLGRKRSSHIARGRQALNKKGETLMWIRIHKKLRADTYKNWRRLNKNGETRKGGGARHWLQSTRTVTCSCETSRKLPCSRTREEDRKSSSSRSTSSRLAAKERLQPIQQQFESNDPRIG